MGTFASTQFVSYDLEGLKRLQESLEVNEARLTRVLNTKEPSHKFEFFNSLCVFRFRKGLKHIELSSDSYLINDILHPSNNSHSQPSSYVVLSIFPDGVKSVFVSDENRFTAKESLIKLAATFSDLFTPRGLSQHFSTNLGKKTWNLSNVERPLFFYSIFVLNSHSAPPPLAIAAVNYALQLELILTREDRLLECMALNVHIEQDGIPVVPPCVPISKRSISVPKLFKSCTTSRSTKNSFGYRFLVSLLIPKADQPFFLHGNYPKHSIATDQQNISHLEQSPKNDKRSRVYDTGSLLGIKSLEVAASPILTPITEEKLISKIDLPTIPPKVSELENDLDGLNYLSDSHMTLQREIKLKLEGPVATEIFPWLFVGGETAAGDYQQLKNKDISVIINAASVVISNFFKESFFYIDIPLTDSPDEPIFPLFALVVQKIEECRLNNKSVFLHCHQGVSRSCSLVLSYVMWYLGISLTRALNYVRERRTVCSPNPGFYVNLLNWEKQLVINSEPSFYRGYAWVLTPFGSSSQTRPFIFRPLLPTNSQTHWSIPIIGKDGTDDEKIKDCSKPQQLNGYVLCNEETSAIKLDPRTCYLFFENEHVSELSATFQEIRNFKCGYLFFGPESSDILRQVAKEISLKFLYHSFYPDRISSAESVDNCMIINKSSVSHIPLIELTFIRELSDLLKKPCWFGRSPNMSIEIRQRYELNSFFEDSLLIEKEAERFLYERECFRSILVGNKNLISLNQNSLSIAMPSEGKLNCADETRESLKNAELALNLERSHNHKENTISTIASINNLALKQPIFETISERSPRLISPTLAGGIEANNSSHMDIHDVYVWIFPFQKKDYLHDIVSLYDFSTFQAYAILMPPTPIRVHRLYLWKGNSCPLNSDEIVTACEENKCFLFDSGTKTAQFLHQLVSQTTPILVMECEEPDDLLLILA